MLIHPQMTANVISGSPRSSADSNSGSNSIRKEDENQETNTSPTQENECLPMENVAIIEDMINEEKLENLRNIVNGTVRKKLYFNPAYFEPHLLAVNIYIYQIQSLSQNYF